MKVILANDHGAIDLKMRVLAWLKKAGHQVVNLGVDDATSVDYPDQAKAACELFLKGGYDLGILMCGTGIGISIAANRNHGIRCALVHDTYTARMAKEHNNANFLAFGGRVDYQVQPEALLEVFLSASFLGGRHLTRINKIDEAKNGSSNYSAGDISEPC